MKSEDIRTLKILEELDTGQANSQRDLARSLNMSLGLVNSFIKRLAHKGYFKVTTIPKNRVKYILTPKGAAEKSRLTLEYIKYSFKFYKNAREKARLLLMELSSKGVRDVLFFGTGDLAEIAYISIKETRINLLGVISTEKSGKFLGMQLLSPEVISRISFDAVIITNMEKADLITGLLEKAGVNQEKILLLDPS